MVSKAGEAVRPKSAKKTARVTLAVCPAAVPVTVMFAGLVVVVLPADKPLTVSVVLSPAVIEGGSKEQVPPEQASVIVSVNELGAAALIEKVAVFVPICTTVDRLLAESEKTGSPVPVNVTLWGLPAALSVKDKKPVRLPVPVGVKETLTVQLSPTFREVGSVPHVLVSA